MKISKIELENLNSLKGYWCIDFTHPDYKKNHELFVISGVTGSGKTTILDAITLALYGRTPRQSKVGKGVAGNELMTRTTGNCMARVHYDCGKHHYVSEFLQERTYRKADGNLKQGECRILKDEVEIFSGIPQSLSDETAKIIHLDYEQFCRSILLAQGEFDRFLKDDGKNKEDLIRDRAEILAKINGTEKYKKVGAAVGLKASEVFSEFKKISEKKESFSEEILSEDELKEMKAEKKTLSEEVKALKETLTDLRKKMNWLEQLSKLKDKYQTADEELKQAKKDKSAFSRKEGKLNLAQKANNCEAAFKVFENIQVEKEEADEALKELKEQLPDAEKTLKKISEEDAKILAKLEAQKAFVQENEKCWKEVRALDSKISSESDKLSEAQENKNAADEKRDDLKDEIDELKATIEELSEKGKEAEKYIKENAKDEALSEMISGLDNSLKQMKVLKQKISKSKKEIDEKSSGKKIALKEKESVEAELKVLEKEMKEFVSGEFLNITRILKESLEDGKPCPVCGSTEHSGLGGKTKGNPKNKELKEKASDLSERKEALDENLAEIKAKLSALDAGIESLNKSESEAEEQVKVLEAEATKLLEPWGFNAETVDVIEVLSKKAKSFKEKKESLEGLDAENNSNKTLLAAKKEDFASAKKECTALENKCRTLQEKVSDLKKQRIELFGKKDVEKEESENRKKLSDLEEDLKTKNNEKSQAEKKCSNISSQIELSKSNLSEIEKKLKDAEKSFNHVLKKNDFESKEDFVSARLEEEELDSLEKEKDSIDSKLKTSEALFNKTKADFKEQEAKKLCKESLEEVQQKHEELENLHEEKRDRITEIDVILKNNEEKKDELAEISREFEAKKKENDIWEKMKFITGKQDGSDLSVYVQSIVFKNLLNYANRYLEKISGKYRLVQKDEKVDFDLYDGSFEEVRSITNISGGEKFIISLSLALGIAEMASRQISVDSLFLDEGFGTLSGEPLTEAINALKSLQASGKMIGIITHIEQVIHEFDQRIVVEPVASGFSRITGSGISSNR